MIASSAIFFQMQILFKKTLVEKAEYTPWSQSIETLVL